MKWIMPICSFLLSFPNAKWWKYIFFTFCLKQKGGGAHNKWTTALVNPSEPCQTSANLDKPLPTQSCSSMLTKTWRWVHTQFSIQIRKKMHARKLIEQQNDDLVMWSLLKSSQVSTVWPRRFIYSVTNVYQQPWLFQDWSLSLPVSPDKQCCWVTWGEKRMWWLDKSEY